MRPDVVIEHNGKTLSSNNTIIEVKDGKPDHEICSSDIRKKSIKEIYQQVIASDTTSINILKRFEVEETCICESIKYAKCTECEGTGQVTHSYNGRYVSNEIQEDCPLCQGDGYIDKSIIDDYKIKQSDLIDIKYDEDHNNCNICNNTRKVTKKYCQINEYLSIDVTDISCDNIDIYKVSGTGNPSLYCIDCNNMLYITVPLRLVPKEGK